MLGKLLLFLSKKNILKVTVAIKIIFPMYLGFLYFLLTPCNLTGVTQTATNLL